MATRHSGSGNERRPDGRRGRVRRFGSQIVHAKAKANAGLASPADSGYRSVDDDGRPEASPTRRRPQPARLDGPGSWDESSEPSTASQPRRGSKGSKPQARAGRRAGAKGRVGDRFVPARDPWASMRERHQTAKQPRALSPAERLVRHGAASADPFSPRRRAAGLARAGDATDLGATGLDDGRVRLLRCGTNARLFTMASLTARPSAQDELESYHGRVASALDMDRARWTLDFGLRPSPAPRPPVGPGSGTGRVLDAPGLRDDYCSTLAYSVACQTLAVGLGNMLYTWSDEAGVRTVNGAAIDSVWLTSVAFSSASGNKSILAAGRSDGSLILRSMDDGLPRFEVQQPWAATCLIWRPCCVMRLSRNPLNPGVAVQTDDLVGDETGTLYYYVVEWPMSWEVSRDTWPGAISLVARLLLHSQQICGLAWSPGGRLLASGANDNLCCLVEADEVLGPHHRGGEAWTVDAMTMTTAMTPAPGPSRTAPRCGRCARRPTASAAWAPGASASSGRTGPPSRPSPSAPGATGSWRRAAAPTTAASAFSTHRRARPWPPSSWRPR